MVTSTATQLKAITHPYPKAILFDWDETLVSTWMCFWELCQKYSNLCKISLGDEKEIKERSVRDGPFFFRNVFGAELANEIQKSFLKDYDACHIDYLFPKLHAESMLKNLNQRGIFTGIVSNKETHRLIRELNHLNWNNHFNVVVGRGDTLKSKPDAAPIFHALSKIGVPPGDNVWFVGDTVVDHQAAKASGCYSVIFGTDHNYADLSVTNWNQLDGILSLIDVNLSH